MGRPETSWFQARIALRAYARGASMMEAGAAAGISNATVHRLDHEHGVVTWREHKPRANALSIDERERIWLGINEGLSAVVIAGGLGRHRSTISREIAAGGGRRKYRAYRAQDRADRAARRTRERWWISKSWLFDIVWDLLVTEDWSPEQISRALKRDHPNNPEWWVSHESIYQALYVQGKGELKARVKEALRSDRTRRQPQSPAVRNGGQGALDADQQVTWRMAFASDESSLRSNEQASAVGITNISTPRSAASSRTSDIIGRRPE